MFILIVRVRIQIALQRLSDWRLNWDGSNLNVPSVIRNLNVIHLGCVYYLIVFHLNLVCRVNNYVYTYRIYILLLLKQQVNYTNDLL